MSMFEFDDKDYYQSELQARVKLLIILQNENSKLRAENKRLREELESLKKMKVREVTVYPKCERCQTQLDPHTGSCMCSK